MEDCYNEIDKLIDEYIEQQYMSIYKHHKINDKIIKFKHEENYILDIEVGWNEYKFNNLDYKTRALSVIDVINKCLDRYEMIVRDLYNSIRGYSMLTSIGAPQSSDYITLVVIYIYRQL